MIASTVTAGEQAASTFAQWQRGATPTRRLAGLALLAGALAACTQVSAWSAFGQSFVVGVEPRLGPEGLEPRPSAAAARSAAAVAPLMPSTPVAATMAAPGLRAAAALVSLALVAAGRSARGAQRQGGLVALRSQSPFPTPPTGSRGAKRQRAGRKRPVFDGKQIAVRVYQPTNKPIKYRMHVKPGDTVQVVSGKDEGKVTTVLKTYPKWNKILCLGVNFCIKHVRPRREDEVGQRVQCEAPMHASCVMHYSEKEQVCGYLGIRYVMKANEKTGDMLLTKERYNKATGEAIPKKKAPEWVPVLDRVSPDQLE